MPLRLLAASLSCGLCLVMPVTPLRAAPPMVVADIAPVHALVARVMAGSDAAPVLILPPGQSPHHAALRPSQARALSEAGLLVWIGPELSPALARAVATADPQETLELLALPQTRVLPLRDGATFAGHDHDHGGDQAAALAEDGHAHAHDDDHGDEHDHDQAHGAASADVHDAGDGHDDDHGQAQGAASGAVREAGAGQVDNHDGDHDQAHGAAGAEGHDADGGHGHDHADAQGGGAVAGAAPSAPHDDDHPAEAAGGQAGALIDQHAWLDPDNAAQWLAAIAERLAALDPDGAALYRANAAAGQAELATLSDGVADRLAGTTAAGFVLLHDATQYFEGRFGLRAAGSLSPGDAAATGPVRLAEIRALIDDSGVACLVAEPQHDAALVERLSAETGVPVVLIDPLGADLTPGPALYPALLEGLSERFEACFSGS